MNHFYSPRIQSLKKPKTRWEHRTMIIYTFTIKMKKKKKKIGGNRMGTRNQREPGWLRFLSRRDSDFQKFIFIKLRPTYKKAGTRVSYFLIYYRKIIVPLKSQCRNSGLPLVSFIFSSVVAGWTSESRVRSFDFSFFRFFIIKKVEEKK